MVTFSVFDHLIDPVLAVDKSGFIYYCNEAFAKMVGVSLGRLVGKRNILQLAKDSHVQILCGQDPQMLNVYHELSFTFNDNNQWRVQVCCQQINHEHQQLFLSFFKDVTLEERLHRKYKNELASNQALIQKLDKKLFASQFLLSVLELSSASTSTANLIYQLIDKICEDFKFQSGALVTCDGQQANGKCMVRLSRPAVYMNGQDLHKNLVQLMGQFSEKIISLHQYGRPAIDKLNDERFLFVPFVSDKAKHNLLVFMIDDQFELSIDNLELFTHLIKQVGLAIENRALYEDSITDEKTQVYNARYFKMALSRSWEKSAQASQHLSLLLMDIDYFKKVNDQYGHMVGDMVLFEVAALIKKACRMTDTVARYGGEEFVLILPDTNPQGAFVVAERIRQSIEKLAIKLTDGRELKVTISIGISTRKSFVDEAENFVIEADQALYKAKENGRNQCVVYSGQGLSKISSSKKAV